MDELINFRPEEELLLNCCRTQLEEENKLKIESLINNTNINWDYLLELASMHRLVPLLYWHLKSFDLNVESHLLEMLKTLFEMNTNKNLLFLGELFKIIEAAKINNITIIPFKGPILAILVYKNLSLRQFDDLDFFVHQNEVKATKKIINSFGYMSKLDLTKNEEKFYIKTQREFKFYNPNKKINIELHWRLIGLSFFFRDDIFRNPASYILKIQNKEVSILENELLFILLCVHAAGHRWERLNWLCDISEMVKSQDLKWDLIFSKAEELGVKRILILNLLLANDLLGMKIPDFIKHDINVKNELNGIIFQIKQSIFCNEKNLYSKATLRLKIREKNIDKIMDFFRITFLPTNKEYASLKIPISLFPLYYLYRFFKVIKDY